MFFYQIDLVETIEGAGVSPRLLVPLLLGLPDTSMYAAMKRGGMDFLGWGMDREIASATHDQVALNTEATGNWKNKAPSIPRIPHPKPPKPKMSFRDAFRKMRNSPSNLNH